MTDQFERRSRPSYWATRRCLPPQSGRALDIDEPWPWEAGRRRSWRDARRLACFALPAVVALALIARCAEPANAREPVQPAITCTATDGDTLNCWAGLGTAREKIRLIGIDAPELPGHCRQGRICAPGDPVASRGSLARALRTGAKRGPIIIVRHGRDKYRRTLAEVMAGGINLSCHQLRTGAAIYVPEWDKRGRIGKGCR